jgi:hypothetical protein
VDGVIDHEVELLPGETGEGQPLVILRLAKHSLDDDLKPYMALPMDAATELGVALIRAAAGVGTESVEVEDDG